MVAAFFFPRVFETYFLVSLSSEFCKHWIKEIRCFSFMLLFLYHVTLSTTPTMWWAMYLTIWTWWTGLLGVEFLTLKGLGVISRTAYFYAYTLLHKSCTLWIYFAALSGSIEGLELIRRGLCGWIKCFLKNLALIVTCIQY